MSPDPNDYRIGWICTRIPEFVIACEMLDEEFDKPNIPDLGSRGDEAHTYHFGRIHQHNVVIAHLPEGKHWNDTFSAFAKGMVSQFRNLKFGLLVGTAGGAPSEKHDIRLGDVVVGIPTQENSEGVVAYDRDRATQCQEFEVTWHLTPPPSILLNALTELRVQHARKGHRIAEVITEKLEKNGKLRKTFKQPAVAQDKLYESSFIHTSTTGKPCDCQIIADRDINGLLLIEYPHLIERRERDYDADDPAVHYGLIASADVSLHDPIVRDKANQEHGVLCFDTESASLLDAFNCITIRGISDYSDTHVGGQWQGYAAATAAAYAKELLEIIDGSTVLKIPAIDDKITRIPTRRSLLIESQSTTTTARSSGVSEPLSPTAARRQSGRKHIRKSSQQSNQSILTASSRNSGRSSVSSKGKRSVSDLLPDDTSISSRQKVDEIVLQITQHIQGNDIAAASRIAQRELHSELGQNLVDDDQGHGSVIRKYSSSLLYRKRNIDAKTVLLELFHHFFGIPTEVEQMLLTLKLLIYAEVATGMHTLALETLENCIPIAEKEFGVLHEAVLDLVQDFILLYESQEEWSNALRWLKRVWHARVCEEGNHLDIKSITRNYRSLLAKADKEEEIVLFDGDLKEYFKKHVCRKYTGRRSVRFSAHSRLSISTPQHDSRRRSSSSLASRSIIIAERSSIQSRPRSAPLPPYARLEGRWAAVAANCSTAKNTFKTYALHSEGNLIIEKIIKPGFADAVSMYEITLSFGRSRSSSSLSSSRSTTDCMVWFLENAEHRKYLGVGFLDDGRPWLLEYKTKRLLFSPQVHIFVKRFHRINKDDLNYIIWRFNAALGDRKIEKKLRGLQSKFKFISHDKLKSDVEASSIRHEDIDNTEKEHTNDEKRYTIESWI